MKKIELSKEFWNDRYLEEDTGWDLGEVSPPLRSYFDQIENKDMKILIPGAGNAYEAEYLIENGFTDVSVLDWSEKAIENLKSRVGQSNHLQLIVSDFFKHDFKYDLIVEQTFFCALYPDLRRRYAKKMAELLNEGGKLVGLLFNIPLNDDKPPYGGDKQEYMEIFSELFEIEIMENAYNSHPARQDNELFIKLIKKSR